MIYQAFTCALTIALAVVLSSCASSPNLSSISVTPNSATLAAGAPTVQFTATGTFSRPGHPQTTEDLTNSVTWASSSPAVATVNSAGLASGIGAGTTSITATMSSSLGPVTGTANLTVTGLATLNSITIIPGTGTQVLNALGETSQFIALGIYTPNQTIVDMTNQVKWQSSDTNVATITSSGLATAVGCTPPAPCLTTITATALAQNDSTVLGTSNLAVNPGSGSSSLPSLGVYAVGAGSGTVVSTPSGVDCIVGSGCSGFFTKGSNVTLTATPNSGSTFGGWSSNCVPSTAPTCTVMMNTNQAVGAIFN